jgi:2,4-dienoyl-CoA reductase (NADPH2)
MAEGERALAAALAPIAIGTLRLPHRVAMGSMHMGLEAREDAGPRLAAFYRERALGGAGLICTGGWAVDADGAADAGYGVIDCDAGARALERVAAAVEGTEAALALQLFHAGRYASAGGPGEVVAPSPIPSRLSRATPRELTGEGVLAAIAAFAAAARRGRELGFAAVEVMGSEGYLVDQFLSPETNRRADEWGGDAAGRMRFAVAVAAAVREAVGPGFPVIFRMTGAELMPRSRPFEEVLELARALAGAGVDALNVGVGWHEAPVPTVQGPVPPGVWAPWAEAVKEAVGEGTTVIAGNRLNRVRDAAALLERGRLDMASMARPFLADAELIAKARSQRPLNVCIACNQACIDRSLTSGHVSCMVNPRAGFEAELGAPAGGGGSFAVVGGGPAGMEAARALASLGCEVELLEAAPELGGQFRFARLVPGKEDYGATIRYFEAELERLDVRVRLGHEVGEAEVERLAGLDGVVLATGVVPRRVELPGAEGENVVDYAAAFEGALAGARRVAILGAGGIGVDLAHLLSHRGAPGPDAERFLAEFGIVPPGEGAAAELGVDRTAVAQARGPARAGAAAAREGATSAPEVVLMRREGRIGSGIGPTTRWVWLDALRRAGVETRTDLSYRAIVAGGIEIVPAGGEPELIAAERIAIAAGQERNDALREPLQRAGARLRVVGGAACAGGLNAVKAFADGLRAAHELAGAGAALPK